MRKFTILILVLLFTAGFSSALNIPILEYKDGMETLADDLATALPLNTTVGLNWSDAYIGQLISVPPSFGVGITTGFTTIPYDAIKKVMVDTLGTNEDDIPKVIRDLGMPLPAIAIDGRIGGIILPFDVGFKIGFIPKFLGDQVSSKVDIEYLLVGFDVRYCLLEQIVVIPEVSVGVGFNYLKGSVTMNDMVPDTRIDLGAVNPLLTGSSVDIPSPEFTIDWESKVFDFKAQASWNVLVIQPSVGIGASYAMSSVTGGVHSNVTVNGVPLSTAEPILRALGYDIDTTGIDVSSDVTGWAFRAFGGLSVNILILKLDFGLMYNLIGKNWGATFGGRIQL